MPCISLAILLDNSPVLEKSYPLLRPSLTSEPTKSSKWENTFAKLGRSLHLALQHFWLTNFDFPIILREKKSYFQSTWVSNVHALNLDSILTLLPNFCNRTVLDERTHVDLNKCHSLLDFSLPWTVEFHFHNIKFPPVPADIHDLTGKECSELLSHPFKEIGWIGTGARKFLCLCCCIY